MKLHVRDFIEYNIYNTSLIGFDRNLKLKNNICIYILYMQSVLDYLTIVITFFH